MEAAHQNVPQVCMGIYLACAIRGGAVLPRTHELYRREPACTSLPLSRSSIINIAWRPIS